LKQILFMAALMVSILIVCSMDPTKFLTAASAQTSEATPDYNGDGFADLAVGVPDEDIGSIGVAGAVTVIYGSPSGLSATFKPDQLWSQSSGGINDSAEQGDRFGASLAHGDFNDDGYDDLAIGIPGESVGSTGDAGAVAIIYGSSVGLKSSAAGDGSGRTDQLWHQNVAGIEENSESGDSFGYSVAAGDLNGDNFDDLVVGVPGESTGGAESGAANVIYGSPSGLSATEKHIDQLVSQLSGGEDGDLFAASVSLGDYDNDGNDDLAIGIPGKDSGNMQDAGAVHVLDGSASGLSPMGSRMIIVQGEGGLEDGKEEGDSAGMSLVSADFSGDGFSDLAIGAPFEDIVALEDDAGAVSVIYGSSAGLSSTEQGDGSGAPDQFWHQFNPTETFAQGEPPVFIQHPAAQLDDQYGAALAAGDFDGDGRADLAIGVPGESVAGLSEAGSANMLYGDEGGLQDASPHDQNWHQNSSAVKDVVEESDRLGGSVAAGDYNGDGYSDLAIGVASEDIGASDAGAVNVIYGSPTTLRATASGSTPANQFWSQNTGSVNDSCETGDSFGFSLA
jgi:hypothetical protein